MRPLLSSCALVLTLTAAGGRASAQAPPPPPGYAAIQVAIDDVLMPLIAAAEQDAAQGRPALALARAQLVLDSVATSSTLRVRAEGVRLVAQQGLSGSPPEAQPIDTVLEPLVSSAEADSQRGLHALAIARLDFTLQRATAGGAVAMRAQAVRAAAAQLMSAAAGAAAPAYGTAPPGYAPAPGYGTAPVAPGYATPGSVPSYGGASGYVGAPQAIGAVAPARPSDPTRRGDGEIIELYISAAAFGVYMGFWIPFAAGLQIDPSPGSTGEPEVLVYLGTTILGAGAMALGVLALDSGEGLRTGVAPSITLGLRYGIASGFLMWGALDREFTPIGVDRAGMAERTAMPFAMGLGGALVGALVGFGFQPHTSQVRFVETSGIWGAGIGLFLALAAAEDSQQGFAITAGGLGLALLTTSVMASAGIYTSPRRGWLLTAGFAIGTALAGLIALLGTYSGLFDGATGVQVFGGVAAAASLAGLITVALLSDGMDPPREPAAPPPVQVGIAPAPQGMGAVITASGTL